jgi:hypothetical protein
LAAPSPLEPNTGGEPKFVLPVNEPAPPPSSSPQQPERAGDLGPTCLPCPHPTPATI